jgi:23S rRNA (uracil1939-C5)-methyltransferase
MSAVFNSELMDKHGYPHVIITDPPRAGMHPNVIKQIISSGADRIVYVSCNPATQAHDIELLSARYMVKKTQAVDMFPHTHHVENVALLVRGNSG